MNREYAEKVEVLLRLPLEGREESLEHINAHLMSIADKAKRAFRGMHIVPKLATSKLLCEYQGKQVKVEVNQTKRGIIGGDLQTSIPLCEKAQKEFGLYCEAVIVPMTLLYGGKIAAALSRQHPRDLFDVKYMEYPFESTREGLLFCLLGSDRPLHESFAPNLIDQNDALVNQFNGMTDVPFTYEEFEQTRARLIQDVCALMTPADKSFLVSFEQGQPDWDSFDLMEAAEPPETKAPKPCQTHNRISQASSHFLPAQISQKPPFRMAFMSFVANENYLQCFNWDRWLSYSALLSLSGWFSGFGICATRKSSRVSLLL